MQSGGDGDGSRRGVSAAPGGSLNEQIVVALARLQDDMQSVLERLHTLEALTASQVRLGVVNVYKRTDRMAGICSKKSAETVVLFFFNLKYFDWSVLL